MILIQNCSLKDLNPKWCRDLLTRTLEYVLASVPNQPLHCEGYSFGNSAGKLLETLAVVSGGPQVGCCPVNSDIVRQILVPNSETTLMPIKRGDRVIHRPTGMKCRAVADEDNEGMVQTKQAGGAFAPCRASELDIDNSDIPINSTGTVEVVARKDPSGGYVAVTKDTVNDTEKVGAACPGDPDDFDYDESNDAWTAK